MINISQCKRNSFKGCFYNSGGSGNFKGEVLRIEDNKYLFKDIYVSYTTYGGVIEVGKENHVWIMDAEIFKENGIKVGDCVAFAGEIYPYKRKNGTYDLGIKNPDMVKKIDSYELPSDEELYEQFKQQIKCETCLFNEQCYGICII